MIGARLDFRDQQARQNEMWMEPMRKFWSLALLLMLSASAAQSFAACHAVGPKATGTGSGADWNDSETMPSSFTRGDIYYLMDGTYSSLTVSTAVSGSTLITFKKAQSYDYGRSSDGCSNDISAGWNASTMGAAQAKFPSLTLNNTSYLVFNGNGTATAAGCGVSPEPILHPAIAVSTLGQEAAATTGLFCWDRLGAEIIQTLRFSTSRSKVPTPTSKKRTIGCAGRPAATLS